MHTFAAQTLNKNNYEGKIINIRDIAPDGDL